YISHLLGIGRLFNIGWLFDFNRLLCCIHSWFHISGLLDFCCLFANGWLFVHCGGIVLCCRIICCCWIDYSGLVACGCLFIHCWLFALSWGGYIINLKIGNSNAMFAL